MLSYLPLVTLLRQTTSIRWHLEILHIMTCFRSLSTNQYLINQWWTEEFSSHDLISYQVHVIWHIVWYNPAFHATESHYVPITDRRMTDCIHYTLQPHFGMKWGDQNPALLSGLSLVYMCENCLQWVKKHRKYQRNMELCSLSFILAALLFQLVHFMFLLAGECNDCCISVLNFLIQPFRSCKNVCGCK